jgi:hypothetical protein
LSSKISDSELIIKPLNESYDLSSFTCKHSDLNEFLKDDALNDQNHMISQTGLCFWGNKLVGFITLTIDTIGVKKVIPNSEYVSKYSYPALKIARLAVDYRFERMGIGKYLLKVSMGKAWVINDVLSCRFVTVDSKKESIYFYEKYEFKIALKNTKEDHIPMYFDLYHTILKLNSYVEGKGDSNANVTVLLQINSHVVGK